MRLPDPPTLKDRKLETPFRTLARRFRHGCFNSGGPRVV